MSHYRLTRRCSRPAAAGAHGRLARTCAAGLLSGRGVSWAWPGARASWLALCSLIACLVLSACSDQQPPVPSQQQGGAEPSSAQRAVLPGFTGTSRASIAEISAALGVTIGPGVPPEDAEALHELMSNSGFEPKCIWLSAPGEYTINVWGVIPHAATEFKIRRAGSGWEIVGDSPWVLIG